MKSGRYFFSLASLGELVLNINNYVSTNRPLSRTWVSRISLIIPIISEDVIVIWRLSQEIIIIFPGRIYQASNSGSDDDIWSGESVQILISSSRGPTLDYLCCRDLVRSILCLQSLSSPSHSYFCGGCLGSRVPPSGCN